MNNQCINFNSEEFLSQLSRYCSVGIFATIVHYFTFITLLSLIDTLPASFIGMLLGTCVAYIGHRHITFLSDSLNKLQPKRFFFVAINYNIINIILMWALVEQVSLPPLLSQLIITGNLGFISFLINKHWSYKDKDVF